LKPLRGIEVSLTGFSVLPRLGLGVRVKYKIPHDSVSFHPQYIRAFVEGYPMVYGSLPEPIRIYSADKGKYNVSLSFDAKEVPEQVWRQALESREWLELKVVLDSFIVYRGEYLMIDTIDARQLCPRMRT
jgi:hypothetical protein